MEEFSDRMTHITWFTNTASESVDVLLGGTIGQPGVRTIGTLDEDTKLYVPVKSSTKEKLDRSAREDPLS